MHQHKNQQPVNRKKKGNEDLKNKLPHTQFLNLQPHKEKTKNNDNNTNWTLLFRQIEKTPPQSSSLICLKSIHPQRKRRKD